MNVDYRIATVLAGLAATPLCGAATVDGLTVPEGFSVSVVFEGEGPGRHLAVRDNGDIYLAVRATFGPAAQNARTGLLALRDTDKDGKVDKVEQIKGVDAPSGVRFYKGMLYVSDYTTVYRYQFNGDELVPSKGPEVIVTGFKAERQHADKTFTFDTAGHMYVNSGAPSNACENPPRGRGAKGQDPCPLLDRQGGIWRFDAEKPNQDQVKDGVRFATGIRNAVALTWDTAANGLYFVQHGRDQIDSFPFYTAKDNAERTSEEMQLVTKEDTVFGWPYTFYDLYLKQRVLAPEYGGDGKTPAPAGKYPDPAVAFPAHWAPNDVLFYNATQFPEQYRGGAFVAFHGSWNRAPEPQDGFRVVYAPAQGGKMAGTFDVFLDGFRGEPGAVAGGNAFASARFRPVGLAVGPDGSLYVSDSVRGRIWRVSYGK